MCDVVFFTFKTVTWGESEERDVLLTSSGRAVHRHIITLRSLQITMKTFYCYVIVIVMTIHLNNFLKIYLHPASVFPWLQNNSLYCSLLTLVYFFAPTWCFSRSARCGRGCWNGPCWKHQSQTCDSALCFSLGNSEDLHNSSTGKSGM